MEWLSQNWIWLALIAGAVLLFSRGRRYGAMAGCGHEMAHEGPRPHEARKSAEAEDGKPPPQAKEGAPGDQSAHRRRGGCC